jgi:hypothetical protein
MASSPRRTGLSVPENILGPTQPPDEPAEAAVEQGEASASAPEKPKARSKPKGIRGAVEKVEGRRLYLSEGVHFRLRIVAYQRGCKISEVAEELLDRSLPKFDVTRAG